jgi:hypothetical protein
MRKPFDRALFAENDAIARSAVVRYYQQFGIKLTANPKRYGIDLLLLIGDTVTLGVECEIKRVWTGPVLQYDTVQLPDRKTKYLSDEYPIEYWIINNEQTHALVIPGEAVRTATPVEVRNKYVWKGEKFYQIPVTECKYVEIPAAAEPGVPQLPTVTSAEVGDSGTGNGTGEK